MEDGKAKGSECIKSMHGWEVLERIALAAKRSSLMTGSTDAAVFEYDGAFTCKEHCLRDDCIWKPNHGGADFDPINAGAMLFEIHPDTYSFYLVCCACVSETEYDDTISAGMEIIRADRSGRDRHWGQLTFRLVPLKEGESVGPRFMDFDQAWVPDGDEWIEWATKERAKRRKTEETDG